MLGVGDRVADDVLKEDLEYASGLLVDEARDALDTATAGEAPDGGLGDALDVVPEHLAVALGAALAESLSSFSASWKAGETRIELVQCSGRRWVLLGEREGSAGKIIWSVVGASAGGTID